MQEIASWIQLYRTPTGRRLFAHHGILVVLETYPDLDVVRAHVVTAIAHDEQTHLLEAQWAAAKRKARVGPEAIKLDYELDRVVGTLHATLTTVASSLVPTMPIASAVKLLEELFPGGISPIIHLSHEEEATAIVGLIQRLEGEFSAEAQRLNLVPIVEHLKGLVAELKRHLTKRPKDSLSFDVVRAAQEKGQALYYETVARILGTFPSASEADTQARAALLAPIWHQNEDLRASFTRRSKAVDVDPKTGEPVEPDASDEDPEE